MFAKKERDAGQIVLGSSGGGGGQGRGHKIKYLRASFRDSRGAGEGRARAKVAREQQGFRVRKFYIDGDINLALAQNVHGGGGPVDVAKKMAAKPAGGVSVPPGLNGVLLGWSPMTHTPSRHYRQGGHNTQEALIRGRGGSLAHRATVEETRSIGHSDHQ